MVKNFGHNFIQYFFQIRIKNAALIAFERQNLTFKKKKKKTYRNLFYLKGHVIMTRGVRALSVGYPLRYPLHGAIYWKSTGSY